MKIFVDTNVLLTVMLRELNHFDASAHLLSLANDSRNKLVTTTLALGSAFYMLEKKYGNSHAKKKIQLTISHLFIAPCDEKETRNSLENVQVTDFEDGLQYYAALHSKCDYIVTYDQSGFYYSTIPILTPEDFLKQYIKQRKTK